MSLLLNRRKPFSVQNPYRSSRPASDKIIFLSCEGSVTEEEYFVRVMEIFQEYKSKIQFISVAEDAVNTKAKYRTPDQVQMLSKTKPLQLVCRIDEFKIKNEDKYQFGKYPNDEFWIITDVDNNWDESMLEKWNNAISECENKKYLYAVSNPFFEIWLLLHFSDVIDEDKKYAVTDEHAYEPTDHFRKRLEEVGAPLKEKKHLKDPALYTAENVKIAIARAKSLLSNKDEKQPKYYATTVFRLLEEITQLN